MNCIRGSELHFQLNVLLYVFIRGACVRVFKFIQETTAKCVYVLGLSLRDLNLLAKVYPAFGCQPIE